MLLLFLALAACDGTPTQHSERTGRTADVEFGPLPDGVAFEGEFTCEERRVTGHGVPEEPSFTAFISADPIHVRRGLPGTLAPYTTNGRLRAEVEVTSGGQHRRGYISVPLGASSAGMPIFGSDPDHLWILEGLMGCRVFLEEL